MNRMKGNNNLAGPLYLEGLTEIISPDSDLKLNEWKRKLRLPNGETGFRIRYYGDLSPGPSGLITATSFSRQLVVAISVDSGQEILLFDGCRHGYNALFSDSHSEAEKKPDSRAGFYKQMWGRYV